MIDDDEDRWNITYGSRHNWHLSIFTWEANYTHRIKDEYYRYIDTSLGICFIKVIS